MTPFLVVVSVFRKAVPLGASATVVFPFLKVFPVTVSACFDLPLSSADAGGRGDERLEVEHSHSWIGRLPNSP